MRDVISTALLQGRKMEETRVNELLDGAQVGCKDGKELLRRMAGGLDVPEAALAADVARFRHADCKHVGGGRHGAPAEDPGEPEVVAADVTQFAIDVTTHVVLHELGHALVREFDLPVLGNEETIADAFATHYVIAHMPERALDVLSARVSSLMHEAHEVPRAQWPVRGEHNSDARRAYQIAALAIAADAEKYAPIADLVDMSERDRKKSRDYAAEIHRSWRRILRPLRMPVGELSNEARVQVADDDNETLRQIEDSTLPADLLAHLRRFDWHSQVTVRFAEGDGGAGWSRSRRTITVNSGYVQRFVRQGRAIAASD